ncbi:hypothetical protein M011DRAFT_406364 [Sporormia fimetaria CBS 119925]|uniref:C2H2-type domain-containing protein n=1 Tax=Sporormia fimetaria CBS 119925 TaxID=1340428 RepID=A0A6A6V8A6_9PLEO|nr:hypothetical protein M011DRAFT_406364 [Sporormia fimetaria CBS 119925]
MIRPADFGQAAPRAASKVAFRGKNGLDFLASAVQQESLLKLDISTSTKESTPTHPDTTSPASAIRTPEPPLHICKWHTSNTGPCLQIFETPEALHKHLKAAHVENCSACFCQWDSCESRDKDFKQRSKLSRHLLGHAGYRPYACTWKDCDKTFATNQAKDNHERTHTGVKPYVCSQCGYQTTTHTQLYTHINARHDGKKKHKCRHCDFTCADSSNLSKHERTHNQHRPYRCPNDGCAFKPDCRWENLKRHLRKSKHCPELLEEGSPANKAYKERVRREKEEWERMAAGIGLRTGTVTPGVGVGVGERQMSGNGAEGLG